MDHRIAKQDKWQLFLGMAGLLLTLALPLFGVGISMISRLSVVESQVQDLRDDVRDIQRDISRGRATARIAPDGGAT